MEELNETSAAWYYDGQATLFVKFAASDESNLLTLQYEATE